MSNYIKATDFASKDDLLSGDPQKVIKGAELDDEFNAIQTAVNTKANANNTAITGGTINDTVIGNATPDLITGTTVTATVGFVGDVTGDVTGNVTGDVTGAVTLGTELLTLTNWTVQEVNNVLYFKHSGTSKAKLDSSGNLVVVGNVTAYGTI